MALSIQHLAFQRNNELLFSEVSLELQAGEMLQVRGDNGCGKSTLLRILAGYIYPETGSVLWQGKNIFQNLDDYSEAISYLGHQNGLKPHLTVYENLKLACALSGIKAQPDALKNVLYAMKLTHAEKTQAVYLSAGQKRRLALARLQLIPTRLWILDEPATALDHAGQHLLAEMLKLHLAQGGMAIVATHHDSDGGSAVKTLELASKASIHV